ncbi:MAG: DUF4252 domain-containing protein [Acidobacteria bacterium]|nr:DUF4252 domain-containing protein [Acidobacteriota bacterium]
MSRTFTSRIALIAMMAAVAVVIPVRASGQEARLSLPAFDDLARRASESVDITLDLSLLRLAAGFLSDAGEDAAIKELVGGLQGVYVKSFEFDADGAYNPSDVDRVRAQLAKGPWARLVDVRSARDRSQTEVYVWRDQGVSKGLAVVSTEPRRLTIVNIVGTIDIDKLRRLEGQFGIPKLDLEAQAPPRK